MAKAHNNGAYRHGLFAGWDEYRHGRTSKTEQRVYRPGKPKPPKVPQKIVDLAADAMREWMVSPWEAEADIRSMMRNAFLEIGATWQFADELAALAVHRAFVKLNRGPERRPHKDEGQLEWTRMGGDYCLGCGEYHVWTTDQFVIHAEFKFRTAHYLFCSPECAELVIKRREYVKKRRPGDEIDHIGRAAESMLERAKSKDRVCECCGNTFKPRYDRTAQKYCSRACKFEAQKTIPPRNCQCCGTEFTPRNSTNPGKYCSKECEVKGRALVTYDRRCQWCDANFTANVAKAKFCCHAHAQAHHRASHGRLPAKLAPPVFDFLFAA